jgi:hypothetical protein
MAIYIECPSRPAKTLYDLNVEAGLSVECHLPTDPGPNASRAARERFAKDLATYHRIRNGQMNTIVEPVPGPQFICGKIEQEPFCACGHTAEMLCDYPMGDGKTCDLPVCWCCSRHIAEDRDLCLIHFAEFVGKARAERINPWPPRR